MGEGENLFITGLNKKASGHFTFGDKESVFAISDSYKTPIDFNESCKCVSNWGVWITKCKEKSFCLESNEYATLRCQVILLPQNLNEFMKQIDIFISRE